MNRIYKTCVRFFFSHVGLFIVLCAYCAGGAYMFQKLEGGDILEALNNGTRRAKEIETERKAMIQEVYRIKRVYNTSTHSIWLGRQRIKQLVERYHQNLTEAILLYGYDGTVHEEVSWPWAFGSAFLFCVTMITLIGYGHVFPLTGFGQFLTMPYALLGIPLMLMCLTNVGQLFADSLRFVYGFCCCRLCSGARGKAQQRHGVTGANERIVVDEEGNLQDLGPDAADVDEEEDDRVQLPVALVAFVIVFYLFMGTILFLLMENWSFCESLYFCFVSMTTIGFGDYVPGLDSIETFSGQAKMMVTCLYLIIGIGIVGMGINLLVAAFVVKYRSIGRTIGVVEEMGDTDGDGMDDGDGDAIKSKRRGAMDISGIGGYTG